VVVRPGWIAFTASAVLLLGAIAWGGPTRRQPPDPAWRVAAAGEGGARNLRLADEVSFTDDSSSAFPIEGENLSDGRIASDRPTAIFFGTAHCWNTAREAERFVKLYRAHAGDARFLVVDLNAPSADQRSLIARLYSGYIPTVAFLDRTGRIVYDRSGETSRERGDSGALETLLADAAAPRPGE
jgi:hypothetical protein